MKSIAIIFGYGIVITVMFLMTPMEWWPGMVIILFSLGVYSLYRTAQGY